MQKVRLKGKVVIVTEIAVATHQIRDPSLENHEIFDQGLTAIIIRDQSLVAARIRIPIETRVVQHFVALVRGMMANDKKGGLALRIEDPCL